MKIIALTAIAALLGGCSTTPSTPAPGSASTSAAGDFVVVQDGTTYTLQKGVSSTASGVTLFRTHDPAASSTSAYGFSNADVTAVGGVSNGTYITGLTGTQTTGLATSGTLNMLGLYGLNYNGNAIIGGIGLAADLAAGTFTGSAQYININGTINGASITGTLVYNGSHSSTLTGGFYGAAAAPTLAATFAGTNLAGVLVVN